MLDRDQPTRPPGSRPDQGEGQRKLLRTGTYLDAHCPHCGHDLAEHNWVRLAIIGPGGEPGLLRLSPRFNVLQRESTTPLEHGAEIKDILCPGCKRSIVDPDRRCDQCNSKAAKLRIAVVHMDLDLFICTRIGCPWHGLTAEDEQRVILDETPEE